MASKNGVFALLARITRVLLVTVKQVIISFSRSSASLGLVGIWGEVFARNLSRCRLLILLSPERSIFHWLVSLYGSPTLNWSHSTKYHISGVWSINVPSGVGVQSVSSLWLSVPVSNYLLGSQVYTQTSPLSTGVSHGVKCPGRTNRILWTLRWYQFILYLRSHPGWWQMQTSNCNRDHFILTCGMSPELHH
jgi:hypothetical protein